MLIKLDLALQLVGRGGQRALGRGDLIGEAITGPLRSIPVVGDGTARASNSVLSNLGGSIGPARGWVARMAGSAAQSAGLRVTTAGSAFELNSLFWSAGSVALTQSIGSVID